MIIVFRMASGGHRIQGEHYHNEDIHLTVAYLRARKAQLSPQDAYYQRVQPERCQLKPQDRKTYGMPKYSEPSTYSSKYNNIRCSMQDDKRELKRRLLYVQKCEAEAEIEKQKRAEKWRQLVVKEEREERERKGKIENLQKLIKREMQQAHPRCHTDVNSANSSTPNLNGHTDSNKVPLCSSATNKHSDLDVETDDAEQTALHSVITYVGIAPYHDTTSTVYKVEHDLPPRDQMVANALEELSIKEQTDQSSVSTTEETDSPDDITIAETDNHDDITTAETDNHDDITTAERDNHDDITTAETDNHGDITTAEKNNHDDITKELPQRTPVNTELQIQQTGVVALTQPEANPTVQLTTELQIHQTDGAVITQLEATPTVLLTTDVTKKQQCHSKEVQTQDTEVDTAVSMTQPTATQDSESTPQIIIDSDTRPEPYDTIFWYHLSNTDGLKKTPESMSTVFICCHSEYSCVILYLLLYS